MKKRMFIIALGLFMGLLAAAAAEETEGLYTVYQQRQADGSLLVQAGWVDESGALWEGACVFAEQDWPAGPDAQRSALAKRGCMEKTGQFSSDDWFSVRSLIDTAEPQEAPSPVPAPGMEQSWSLRRGLDGEREWVLLGTSGEAVYENTDPSAQALYRKLRQWFPQVTSDAERGPRGFAPVGIAEFCGLDAEALATARIELGSVDCEAGYVALPLTPEDEESIRRLVAGGTVTGKENSLMVTGGIYVYSFYDEKAGDWLADLEFYQGLLVLSDGMYAVTE